MTDFRRCGVSARDDRTAIREADDRVSAHKEPCLYSNAAEEMPIENHETEAPREIVPLLEFWSDEVTSGRPKKTTLT